MANKLARLSRHLVFCAALGALAGTVPQASAEVYKWTGADGSVQYGDRPPKGVNAQPVSGGVTVMPAFRAPEVPAVQTAPAPAAIPPAQVPAARPESPARPASSGEESAQARRQRLIEACQRNRGANCEQDVDAQLDGVPGAVFVPVPGWSRPPIRPSRPVQPQPQPETRPEQKPVREAARPGAPVQQPVRPPHRPTHPAPRAGAPRSDD